MSNTKGGTKIKRREFDIRHLEEIVAEAERLKTTPYRQAGHWDLSQICNHLSQSFDCSITGFPYKAAWPIRKIIAPMFLPGILKKRRIRPGVGLRKDMAPQRTETSAAVAKLKKSVDRYIKHSKDLAPHPFFGKLTRETWRDLHCIHAAHHLSFLVPQENSEGEVLL